ncbi:hypothetical protein GC176_08415 [bacterium]|nr:hypothetical protein [bacterium]
MNQEPPSASEVSVPETPTEEPRRNEPEHPLFKLVIVSSAAFLVTVLSMVVAMLSPSESPLAKFINRNGVRMIAVEVVLIITVGILAMATDRRQTLQNGKRRARDISDEATDSEIRQP